MKKVFTFPSAHSKKPAEPDVHSRRIIPNILLPAIPCYINQILLSDYNSVNVLQRLDCRTCNHKVVGSKPQLTADFTMTRINIVV